MSSHFTRGNREEAPHARLYEASVVPQGVVALAGIEVRRFERASFVAVEIFQHAQRFPFHVLLLYEPEFLTLRLHAFEQRPMQPHDEFCVCQRVFDRLDELSHLLFSSRVPEHELISVPYSPFVCGVFIIEHPRVPLGIRQLRVV